MCVFVFSPVSEQLMSSQSFKSRSVSPPPQWPTRAVCVKGSASNFLLSHTLKLFTVLWIVPSNIFSSLMPTNIPLSLMFPFHNESCLSVCLSFLFVSIFLLAIECRVFSNVNIIISPFECHFFERFTTSTKTYSHLVLHSRKCRVHYIIILPCFCIYQFLSPQLSPLCS